MNPLVKKIALVCLVILICLPFVAALPEMAHGVENAQIIEDGGVGVKAPTLGDFLTNFFLSILNVVQQIIIQLTQVAANGVRWMIDFSSTVMDFPVVKSGFQVTLSLVNLLFVIALIIMAFEIILDFHAGEAKKMLGKLVLAALLINFSLLIAGFLLDISNIFTNFFIEPVNSTSLTAAFSPHRFGGPIFGTGFFQQIGSMLFAILMQGIIFITISAVFVMATVRTVIVAGLLLVMPITWGMWVFPGLKEHHKDWWKNFLKYGVSYLPTLAFFLWLAIRTAANTKYWDDPVTGVINAASVDTGIIGGLLGTIFQLVLIIGIVIFGLKAAADAGGVGADLGMSMAKKAGSGALGYAYDKSGLKRGLQRGAEFGATQLDRARNLPVVGGFLGRFTGIAGLANKAAGFAHQTHDMEEWQKNNLSQRNDHDLFAFQARNDKELAAKLAEISKRGLTGDFLAPVAAGGGGGTAEQIREMAAASGRINHKTGDGILDIKEVKDVVDKFPLLAAALTNGARTITEQMGRLSPGSAAGLHHSNFADTAAGNETLVALSNNAAQLKAVLTNGTPATQRAVREGLARLRNGNGVPAGAANHIPALPVAIRNADVQLRRLDDLIDGQRKRGESRAAIEVNLTARNNLITATQANVRRLPAADRGRAAAFLNGRAVSRQVISRDTGNIINP